MCIQCVASEYVCDIQIRMPSKRCFKTRLRWWIFLRFLSMAPENRHTQQPDTGSHSQSLGTFKTLLPISCTRYVTSNEWSPYCLPATLFCWWVRQSFQESRFFETVTFFHYTSNVSIIVSYSSLTPTESFVSIHTHANTNTICFFVRSTLWQWVCSTSFFFVGIVQLFTRSSYHKFLITRHSHIQMRARSESVSKVKTHTENNEIIDNFVYNTINISN